jgi:hypothetical protein
MLLPSGKPCACVSSNPPAFFSAPDVRKTADLPPRQYL